MKKIGSPLSKTLALAACFATLSGYAAYLLQSMANKSVTACSYLDPVTVDILALAIAAFLIIESLASIFKHKESSVRSQLIRCVRLCIGAGILVIHIMQFMHK